MLGRVSNATLWAVLVITGLTFIPLELLFERPWLFEFFNLLIIAVAAGTVVGFHPAAVRAVQLPVRDLTPGQVLVVGLVLASIAVIIIFTGQWLWRVYEKNHDIVDHWTMAFGRWMLFVSWVMTLLASGSHEGKLPVSTYKRAGLFVFAAIVAFGIMIALVDSVNGGL